MRDIQRVGFDRKTAESFIGGRKRAVFVSANTDYTLTVLFNNGEKKLYDMKPLIEESTIFAVLADMDLFSRVYIADGRCIAWDIDPNADSEKLWNNRIDLCADECYVNGKTLE